MEEVELEAPKLKPLLFVVPNGLKFFILKIFSTIMDSYFEESAVGWLNKELVDELVDIPG